MGPVYSQLRIRPQAAALLHAVADGDSVSLKDVRALAEAVLNSRPVLLAQAVLEAEPVFAIARAVELAAGLLSQACDADGSKTDSDRADCAARNTDDDAK